MDIAERANVAGGQSRRHRRYHLTTAVVVIVVAALAVSAFAFTRSVRDDNERRLLGSEADQLGQVVQSLGAQEQSAVVSAAIVANHSAGDPDVFRSVAGSSSSAGGAGQSWALLTRTAGQLVVAASLGADASALAIVAQPSPAADARISEAFAGRFVVVGILGEGIARRLVMAAGAPDGAGPYVAYYEIPLLLAASQGAGTGSGGLADVNVALYVGAEPSPEGLVIATGPVARDHVTRTVSIGSAPITYVVWGKHPLSGGLSTELPWISFSLLLLAGWLVACVIEMNLRRRDAALLLVEQLDAASAARDAADLERGALEAQLRQAQRLEAVGRLAGGVAHDFNNILAAIMGYADLVADDLADQPSRADVDEIRKAARRGAGLTRQLLQFGKDAPASEEPIDLNAGILELQSLLAHAVGEAVEIRTSLAPGLPPVSFGAAELEQLLTNLVVNAGDAIDGPGTISITTDLVEDAGPGPSGDLGPGHVRLTVTDTGTGMEPAVLARVFEPFFTTKEQGRGTGLGLASVYGIVARAGGTIDVRSTPGDGSSFEVVLRCASAEPAAKAQPVVAPTGADGQTILLVEDEDALRVAARRMLAHAGYRVIEAANGVDAAEMFDRGPVDLLLTDVIMPGGVDGKQLADTLQGREDGLHVLFMSGYSANLLARRGIDSGGPANVLEKPFSEEGLLAAVASALQPAGTT